MMCKSRKSIINLPAAGLIVLLMIFLSGCSISLNGNVKNIPSFEDGATEINEKEAKIIVTDMVKGSEASNIVEFKEDFKEGSLIYSGKLVYEDRSYEFEIDEATGHIITWDVKAKLK